MYKIGDIIEIIEMKDEPKYKGRIGKIEHIDDAGQLHGNWGGLAVNLDVDKVRLVGSANKEVDEETNDLLKFKYSVKKMVTIDDMEDILTTAIEGGTNYWACWHNDTPEWEKAENQLKAGGAELYFAKVVLKVLLNGDAVIISDAEAGEYEDEDDAEEWKLTLENLKKGLELYSAERGDIKKALDDGNFDAVEGDCFLQYCLFGDIIFG